MRVLVVSGASGGHIFPALSFLDTLNKYHQDVDALLILPKTSQELSLATPGFRVRYILTAQVKLRLEVRNFMAILKFFKGSLESLVLLLEFRPDIVVGFGSLASIPLILLAWVFRIRTLIHEQNVLPGRANSFLAKFTDRVAISFAQTKGYLHLSAKRIVLTGNPIRNEFKRMDKFKALDFFGLSYDKFTILVMGGSFGSQRVNTGFLNAISLLADKSQLQVIHLTGAKDYDLVNSGYQNLNIRFKSFAFLKDMLYAYNASDLVVSRAGGGAIAEIIFFCLPAIIVPYPLAYQHQLNNAKFLEAKGCAIIIEDDLLATSGLRQTIEELMANSEKLQKMRDNYARISRFAAGDLLVKEVMALN